MPGTIYTIEFPDGSAYVGATFNFSKRRRVHLRAAHRDKYKTSNALTAKLREFPCCAIYALASSLRDDELHLVEADVIASRNPSLNTVRVPSPIHRHSGLPIHNGRPFGPYPSIAAAAKALQTNRTRLREFGSYEAFLAHRKRPQPPRRTDARVGPPDPRKQTTLVFINGGWHRRREVRETLGLGVKAFRTYLRTGKGYEPPTPGAFARLCHKHNITKPTYKARRASGATVRQALGLDPLPPRKPSKVKQRILTCHGRSATLNVWAKRMGIPPNRIHARLNMGWTEAQAVGLDPSPSQAKAAQRPPVEPKRKRQVYTVLGITGTLHDLAKVFPVSAPGMRSRLEKGWTIEEAALIPRLPLGWKIEYARQEGFAARLLAAAIDRHTKPTQHPRLTV